MKITSSYFQPKDIPTNCGECSFREQCGGNNRLFSCFTRCLDCNGECNQVCPNNLEQFRARFLEVGGFGLSVDKTINAQLGMGTARYVPKIFGSSSLRNSLPVSWAALPIYSVIGFTESKYQSLVRNAQEVKDRFGLTSSTKIIIFSAVYDQIIENFWKHVHSDPSLLATLSAIKPFAMTTPNYSMFSTFTRTTFLYNQKRILLSASYLQDAGIMPILHLNAYGKTFWDSWRDCLMDHPNLMAVAKEFGTGLKDSTQAEIHLQYLADLRQMLGRNLHLVAIGGRSKVDMIRRYFENFTILDADPYIKTIRRRRAFLDGGVIQWKYNPTYRNGPLDKLFQHNLRLCEDTVLLPAVLYPKQLEFAKSDFLGATE
jgi:hypothetical protein